MNPYHDKLGRFDKAPTVFVSGSSHTQTKGDPYYRKKLPKEIQNELNYRMKSGEKIIVGDAPGIDRQVQDYLNKKRYKNVEIYGAGDSPRYVANVKWKNKGINSKKYKQGSSEWLAEKDIFMNNLADEGIAVVIENGGSGATRKNIERFIEQYKDVKIYELSVNGDRWIQ